MHELGITQEIVEIVSRQARSHAADAKVTRVVLQIGKLSAVLPDAVRFCFDVVSEGTPLEGAELEIMETPGRAECKMCGGEVLLDRPFGRCVCGCSDLEWLSGEELRIHQMEVV